MVRSDVAGNDSQCASFATNVSYLCVCEMRQCFSCARLEQHVEGLA